MYFNKVNISVNGQPIPYHMKIGEAGEAFFVFETDEDVPPDLITSPILLPTRPEEEASDAQLDATVAHSGDTDHLPSDASVSEETPKALQVESEQEVHDDSQEPDFLDLNASSSNTQLPKQVEGSSYDVNVTPAQRFHQPSFLRHSASQSSIQRQSVSYKLNSCALPSPVLSCSPSPKTFRGTDGTVKGLGSNAEAPEVEYHHGKRFFGTFVSQIIQISLRCGIRLEGLQHSCKSFVGSDNSSTQYTKVSVPFAQVYDFICALYSALLT
jgi:phosphatidate phosphatase LPIN